MNDANFIQNSVDNKSITKYVGKDKVVVIPNGVYCIGERAFAWNYNLQEVIIPNSVMRISDYAFIHCSNLKRVTIGNSVSFIGRGAFLECNRLRTFNVNTENLRYAGKLKRPFDYDSISHDIVLEKANVSKNTVNKIANYFHFFDLDLIATKIIEILTTRKCTKSNINNATRFFTKFLYMISKKNVSKLLEIIRDKNAQISFDRIMNVSIMMKLLKDDTSVMEDIEYLEFPQFEIDKLLDIAMQSNSTSCTAELLNYKSSHFGFNPNVDEFSLD